MGGAGSDLVNRSTLNIAHVQFHYHGIVNRALHVIEKQIVVDFYRVGVKELEFGGVVCRANIVTLWGRHGVLQNTATPQRCGGARGHSIVVIECRNLVNTSSNINPP